MLRGWPHIDYWAGKLFWTQSICTSILWIIKPNVLPFGKQLIPISICGVPFLWVMGRNCQDSLCWSTIAGNPSLYPQVSSQSRNLARCRDPKISLGLHLACVISFISGAGTFVNWERAWTWDFPSNYTVLSRYCCTTETGMAREKTNWGCSNVFCSFQTSRQTLWAPWGSLYSFFPPPVLRRHQVNLAKGNKSINRCNAECKTTLAESHS